MATVQSNTSSTRLRPANPFATRYVAPGKLAWIECGTSLEQLADRFHQLGGRCQIIGPHGSGKSTLLEHLIPKLGQVVYREHACEYASNHHSQTPSAFAEIPSGDSQAVCWFSLRRGFSVMNSLKRFLQTQPFCGILVVDGAEQLGWWQRRRLFRWSRRSDSRLLLTAHRDLGLPDLWQTSVSESLARQVVQQAYVSAVGHPTVPDVIEETQWALLLDKHKGNLRECLMELYDLVETTHREAKEIGC